MIPNERSFGIAVEERDRLQIDSYKGQYENMANPNDVSSFEIDIIEGGETLVSEGGLWAPEKCRDGKGNAAIRGWLLKTEPYKSSKFKTESVFLYMRLSAPTIVSTGDTERRVAKVGEEVVTNLNHRLQDLQQLADDAEYISEVQIVAGEKTKQANGHDLSNFKVTRLQRVLRTAYEADQVASARAALANVPGIKQISASAS